MASERRLAEIRERLAAATPGPWELYATERNVIAITKGRMRSGYRREIVHWSGFDCSNIDDPGQVRANAALIAHAPSDLAYLLDEIARLARELDAARERERAVRDEATGYLAEVAGTLADMHDGDECSFEGGEGCLACYAQDRIAEMQDALAATPPDTEGDDG